MNCPRCNSASIFTGVQEQGAYASTRRQYLCADSAHRFTTVETYEPQSGCVENRSLMNALRAIKAKYFKKAA